MEGLGPLMCPKSIRGKEKGGGRKLEGWTLSLEGEKEMRLNSNWGKSLLKKK